jgi:thymidylate kinase
MADTQDTGAPPSRTPSDVLLKMLKHLRHRDVSCCVISPAENQSLGVGGDVDVVIDQAALPEIDPIIRDFARDAGVELLQRIQHEPAAICFVLAWEDSSQRRRFLQADISGDIMESGRRFLSSDEVLDGMSESVGPDGNPRGFCRPRPAVAFIQYLLKRIDKGGLTNDQCTYLCDRYHRDPEGARQQIARFWAEDDAAQLIEAAESGTWNDIRTGMPGLRAALARTVPRTMRDRLEEWKRILNRTAAPTGLLVAVLGADGAGKSSVIVESMDRLDAVFGGSTCYHFRPMFGRTPDTAHTKAPHDLPPRGALVSIVKLLYYVLDYLVGYTCLVYPRIARSQLVFFDRYFDDILIDPLRYRYGGPMWIVRALKPLVPKPDLVIYLDATADTLLARRAEVTSGEAARQRETYRDYCGTQSHCCIVDAEQPVDAVVTDTCRKIASFMSRRTGARLDP